jgi:hypothetical protein
MAKPITVSIVGNAGPLKKAVGEADTALGKLGGSIGKIGKIGALGFAAAGAAAGAFALSAVKGAEAARVADDRLAAVNKSMSLFGEETNKVTERLQKFADAQEFEQGVTAETIKLTQAKLLTFAELGKTADELGGQFDRATIAAVDLAAAGFGTADANAVQLGKALQDPIKGITALAKSGVTFTEVEKERIQTLVESNKIGEAQEMVLAAIEKQVGGTAAATVTSSFKIGAAFGHIKDTIGDLLLPILDNLASFFVDKIIPFFNEMSARYGPALSETFSNIAAFIQDKLVPVFRDVLLPIFIRFAQFIMENVVPVVMDLWKRVFTGLAGIFDVLVKKIQENRENINKLVSFFKTLADFVVSTVAPILIKVLGGAFNLVTAALGPVLDVVFKLMGAFADMGSFLIKVANSVLDTISSMVNGIIKGVNKAIELLNKLPGVNIDPIGNVSLSLPTISGPSVASGTSFNAPSLADRLPSPSLVVPSLNVPSVGGGGGGSSSGGGGGRSFGETGSTPAQIQAAIRASSGTTSALTTFGMAERIAAMESGSSSQASSVNITVNTVTADANLPNLIVESLQRYNLISGPVDVQIAA